MNIEMWLLAIPPLMLAVIVHEVAHGVVADRLGDPTARMLGRLNLNPMVHIDPIGTILVPGMQLFFSGSIFIAWAKPVPINLRNFRKPLEYYGIVAAAGPASNFVQALLWAIPVWLLYRMPAGGLAESVVIMSYLGIRINLALMVFNLLPVPPLDGSRIVAALLPGPAAVEYLRWEKFSFIGLMILLVAAPGILGSIIGPPIHWLTSWLLPAAI